MAPALLTLAIWATSPFVSALRMWVKAHLGTWVLGYLATALFAAMALAVLHHLVWRLRVRERALYGKIAVLLAFYGFVLVQKRREPIEQMHLFEYGLLAVLVLRALPARLAGKWRYVAATAVTGTLGLLDELVQGLIHDNFHDMVAALARWFDTTPDEVKRYFFIRFYDPADVVLNVNSAILGLCAWALWTSILRRAEAAGVVRASVA